MNRFLAILPALCLLAGSPAHAQKTARLSSPDKQISFECRTTDSAALWSVTYKGTTLITNSPLSLSFNHQPDFRAHLKIAGAKARDGEDDYALLTGKTSHVHDRYRELSIPLEEKTAPYRKIIVVVRAFNDGLAFRYEFPRPAPQTARQDPPASLELTAEDTRFRLAGNPTVKALLLPNFTSSHEGEYTTADWKDWKADSLMDLPALFEFPGRQTPTAPAHTSSPSASASASSASANIASSASSASANIASSAPASTPAVYMAITEAALLDYAGLYLIKHKDDLCGRLSPRPDGSGLCIKADLPHHSPWRVLLISDRVGALIESNIITSLNENSKIDDISWIHPGKTTFPWWNGNVVPDTINAPGNNFVTARYYIDFCARAGLQYHSVVEYGLHEWYTNDGAGFQPGPHADPTRPVPGLDMQQICDYAHQKGIGIRVWVHWAALYPHLDSAFAQFEKWGLSGMMVDFMDRDDQQMVNIQTEMLEKAAQHHLHIQFHGAYKPTGLSRTYPNEFTREGTLNYEVNKWDKRITPDHDLNMPFTRLLAGATDYHLGGFRAVPDSLFRVQYTRPLMLGTRCHMLAMYVVLETNLAMVCDYPEAYEGQPGFEFLQQVPTTWDETKVLDAVVDQYIVIARRKGKDWFIGAITNHEGRTLNIPLDFLGTGSGTNAGPNAGTNAGTTPGAPTASAVATFKARLWTDGTDARTHPDQLETQTRAITAKDKLTVQLAPGGGLAVHISTD